MKTRSVFKYSTLTYTCKIGALIFSGSAINLHTPTYRNMRFIRVNIYVLNTTKILQIAYHSAGAS